MARSSAAISSFSFSSSSERVSASPISRRRSSTACLGAAAASLLEGVDHAAERVDRLVHGDEAVGPASDRARGLLANGCADEGGGVPGRLRPLPGRAGPCPRASPPRPGGALGSRRRTRGARGSRPSFDGHRSLVTCSFRSPDPSAAQNLPGYISASVARAGPSPQGGTSIRVR